jgi:hypothetical protein
METVAPLQVRRRRVFYIPGYDPIHPRRYRELYRREGAEQAKISGYTIDLSPKKTAATYGWHVDASIGGQTVAADVDVLVWSDIVRASMAASIPATYGQLVRTAWTYISSGALRRLMWLRKGPVIAALYPVGMLLLQLVLALGAGAIAAALALWGLNAALGGTGWGTGTVTPFLRWPIVLIVAMLLLRWFKAQDGRIYAHYLMHDYAFSARWGGAYPPALETRMAAFGDLIATALTGEYDEVLVVGHSSGAHLGVTILADLIRAGRVRSTGPVLAFMTLGQVVPMLSFLPRADRLRADLSFLAARQELTWVDVSAPGDGCSFALCDPVAVTGVSPPGKRWPLIMSAAFTQTLSPEKWDSLRWRFFRLHFQYLCAFDRPRDYDYFQITAGPMTLADRYRDRPPSKSRIDVPASKYTSMAA